MACLQFNKMEPTRIVSLEDMVVKCVSCGWSHTVGLTDDGRVYTWGNGDHGKLVSRSDVVSWYFVLLSLLHRSYFVFVCVYL